MPQAAICKKDKLINSNLKALHKLSNSCREHSPIRWIELRFNQALKASKRTKSNQYLKRSKVHRNIVRNSNSIQISFSLLKY